MGFSGNLSGFKSLQFEFHKLWKGTSLGMAESYISGGGAKRLEDIDADINKIVADDGFGQMVLNAGE